MYGWVYKDCIYNIYKHIPEQSVARKRYKGCTSLEEGATVLLVVHNKVLKKKQAKLYLYIDNSVGVMPKKTKLGS